MAFCMNCGKQLPDGAKFCLECGRKLGDTNVEQITQRETTYEGKVYKCPNCGDILDAYESVCETCGYERRGNETSVSIQQIAAELNAVSSENRKADIIQNFPIPNNKEDITEFLILASTSINRQTPTIILNAWAAKIEQCYLKAKLSFKQENDFIKIQAIYEKTNTEIKKIRRRGPLKKVIIIAIPILLTVAFWVWFLAPDPRGEARETERLEAIVTEVEAALENEEFDLAMMHAKSIDYSADKANDELERQWDIKRDYLIKKIIKEAEKKGVLMEYPTDTADEKDRSTSSSYDYKKSKEESDEAIKNNIEEFSEQMDKIKDTLGQKTEGEPNNSTTNIETEDQDSPDSKPVVSTINDTKVNYYSVDCLTITDFGYYQNEGYIWCVVEITNSSEDKAVELPTYRVTAYDEKDKILGTEEQTLSVVYPRQKFICAAVLIEVDKKPDRIDITVLEPEDYNVTSVSALEHPAHKQMIGQNLSVRDDLITGEIYNPNNYKIESAMITVVFRDGNGEIVYGRGGFVDQIPADGTVPFDIDLYLDKELPSDYEVYAYLW